MNGYSYTRPNTFHSQKRQLLGNQAGHVAPAWKTNGGPTLGQGQGKNDMEQGSKIFLSRLPVDVEEKEVEVSHERGFGEVSFTYVSFQELFKKTVGPLKESFLIYNSQGKSKGMAVVSFQRPGDASVARKKYDGKIVDGSACSSRLCFSALLNPVSPLMF
jgi:THO complex subunit 4